MQALVRILVLVAWLPTGASAREPDRVAVFHAAFGGLLVRHATTGPEALFFGAQLDAVMGEASEPIALASVSKSITALSDACRLDFSDRVRDVPVASLAAQTSGVAVDTTRSHMGPGLDIKDHRADIGVNLMQQAHGGLKRPARGALDQGLIQAAFGSLA